VTLREIWVITVDKIIIEIPATAQEFNKKYES